MGIFQQIFISIGKCQCLATIKAVCKKEKDGLGQTPCSIKLYMGFFIILQRKKINFYYK